jgi:DNA polymerase-3 subunit epsilon
MEKETNTEETPTESNDPMVLFIDFETSGFRKKNLRSNDVNQAWSVQVGFILSTKYRVFHECSALFYPPFKNASIHPGAEKTHGISIDSCRLGGVVEPVFMEFFNEIFAHAELMVCHNYNFDSMFLFDLYARFQNSGMAEKVLTIPHVCTMLSTTNLCCLPGRYGKFKWPKLEELHRFLFDEDFVGAHDALADVRATRRCFYELKKRGVI